MPTELQTCTLPRGLGAPSSRKQANDVVVFWMWWRVRLFLSGRGNC